MKWGTTLKMMWPINSVCIVSLFDLTSMALFCSMMYFEIMSFCFVLYCIILYFCVWWFEWLFCFILFFTVRHDGMTTKGHSPHWNSQCTNIWNAGCVSTFPLLCRRFTLTHAKNHLVHRYVAGGWVTHKGIKSLWCLSCDWSERQYRGGLCLPSVHNNSGRLFMLFASIQGNSSCVYKYIFCTIRGVLLAHLLPTLKNI